MLAYLLAWFAMLALAIANGAVRQATFGKTLSELRAHQLSTLTGAAAIGALIWLVVRAWPPASGRHALGIGALWACLTIAFEFFMVLGLQRRPLAHALRDYNLFAGRVWLLFLLWLTFAPWLFFTLQKTGRE